MRQFGVTQAYTLNIHVIVKFVILTIFFPNIQVGPI